MEPGYSISSKPEYGALAWREKAQAHVVVSAGEGAVAVLRLLRMASPLQPVTVLHARQAAGDDRVLADALEGELLAFDSPDELLVELDRRMGGMRMGTHFYCAGSESFIWSVVRLAKRFGVEEQDVVKQQVATLARPVYCVHCKATTPAVTTNIAPCSGCGRQLFVRDHFSRRLGAYMGLMVDAEDPGQIPAVEEVYP